MDMAKFKVGRGHFRNSVMKGLIVRIAISVASFCMFSNSCFSYWVQLFLMISLFKIGLTIVVFSSNLSYSKHWLWYGRRQAKTCLRAVQNVRIHVILPRRKCSSGHLLSTETLYSIQWFYLADCEGPDQTAQMRRLVWAFTIRICPKKHFRLARPI